MQTFDNLLFYEYVFIKSFLYWIYLLLGAVNQHVIDSNIAYLRDREELELLELVSARANSAEFIHPVATRELIWIPPTESCNYGTTSTKYWMIFLDRSNRE